MGVGAIGGLIAGTLGSRLPTSEIALSALARGATLEALQQRGLVLHSEGQRLQVPIRAHEHAADLGPQDLVVLAVKAPSLVAAAQSMAPLLGEHTQVLVAMNGVPWWFFDGLPGPCEGLRLRSVDPDGALQAAVPTGHVIGCVVHAGSSVIAPAEVLHSSGRGLVIGEPTGGITPRLGALGGLLSQAGFAVTVSECIQRDIWFKLWGNMTMNPISALTGATCDRILDDDLVRHYASAVMLEAGAIGEQFGCAIQQSPSERHALTRKLGAFRTSMLQDREAGRPMEVDAIVGAVQEIGRHLGLATPHIDILLGLARLMTPTARAA